MSPCAPLQYVRPRAGPLPHPYPGMMPPSHLSMLDLANCTHPESVSDPAYHHDYLLPPPPRSISVVSHASTVSSPSIPACGTAKAAHSAGPVLLLVLLSWVRQPEAFVLHEGKQVLSSSQRAVEWRCQPKRIQFTCSHPKGKWPKKQIVETQRVPKMEALISLILALDNHPATCSPVRDQVQQAQRRFSRSSLLQRLPTRSGRYKSHLILPLSPPMFFKQRIS
jgi:hypothetical protein